MKGVLWILALVAVASLGFPAVSQADTFDLTSCHISTGCPAPGTVFGTVTLTDNGTGGVLFDVELINGNRFVETGAGGDELFLFNDALSGSTITNISATLNGTPLTTGLGGDIPGGLSGFTNLDPAVHADGTGYLTASVECTVFADCNGGSTPNMNDLHFTVTNATLAQLETPNADGNIFVADILCGQTVTGCAGLTGPVDVSGTPVPEPGTLLLLGAGLLALKVVRFRK